MVLEVKNLSFAYADKPIIKDLNFTLQQSETLGILGVNGVGKSTLLKLIMGLEQIQTGHINMCGADFNNLTNRQRAKILGYVAQKEHSPFAFKVMDVVLMGRNAHISMFGKPSKEDREKAMQALDIVGIAQLSDKIFYELSGGQMQLVTIARALCSFPQILVLDEPISHLDVWYQDRIISLVDSLNRDYKISVIMTSHNIDHTLASSHKTLALMGERGYLFGDTQTIASKENLYKIFDINFAQAEFASKTRILPDWTKLSQIAA